MTQSTEMKLLCSWDETQIIDDEVKYRLEHWQDHYNEPPDEDTVRQQLYEDTLFFEMEWEFLVEYLTEIINEKNPEGYWKAEVVNFGWRNQSGYKYFETNDGQEWIRAWKPNTDCTFYIYETEDGEGFKIQNYHHDSPVGNEWYSIYPVTEH